MLWRRYHTMLSYSFVEKKNYFEFVKPKEIEGFSHIYREGNYREWQRVQITSTEHERSHFTNHLTDIANSN